MNGFTFLPSYRLPSHRTSRVRMATADAPPAYVQQWVEYHGPRHGEGWRNIHTGDVRYQDDKPFDGTQTKAVDKPAEQEYSITLENSKRLPVLKYKKQVTPEEFVEARAKSEKRAGFLSPTSAEELKNHTLWMTEDGKTGMAISPDGDAQNLFNNGGPRYSGVANLLDAIKSGKVKTADCYDGFLPQLYSQFGFVEVGRMKFNREYAPPGWNYERDGDPDVVFIALAEHRDPETVFRLVTQPQEKWQHVKSDKYYEGDQWDEAKAESRRIADQAASRRSVHAAKPDRSETNGTDRGSGSGRERSDGRGARVPGRVSDSGLRAGEPLSGLPARIKVPGVGEIAAGPFQPARDAARQYMKAAGMQYNPPKTYAKIDESRARQIAEAYESMEHKPDDPEVRKAFDAMFREAVAQWNEIEKTGLKISWVDPGMNDPYAASPRLATEDVRNNNHLWVFSSGKGFGSTDSEVNKDSRGLEDSGVEIAGRKLSNVELFRIVHDYFGHIKEGVGFRADGEENAWRQHSAMFSPLARRAMTVATRGQNSWVNYGPHGEKNRTAKAGDTVYADQKVGLLPDWVVTDGAGDDPSTTKMSTVVYQGFTFMATYRKPKDPNALLPTPVKPPEPSMSVNQALAPQPPKTLADKVGAGLNQAFGVGGPHRNWLDKMVDPDNVQKIPEAPKPIKAGAPGSTSPASPPAKPIAPPAALPAAPLNPANPIKPVHPVGPQPLNPANPIPTGTSIPKPASHPVGPQPIAPQATQSVAQPGGAPQTFSQGFAKGFGDVMRPIANAIVPPKLRKLLTGGPLGKAVDQAATRQGAQQSAQAKQAREAERAQAKAKRDAERQQRQAEREKAKATREQQVNRRRVVSAAKKIDKFLGDHPGVHGFDYFDPANAKYLDEKLDRQDITDIFGELDRDEVLQVVKERRDVSREKDKQKLIKNYNELVKISGKDAADRMYGVGGPTADWQATSEGKSFLSNMQNYSARRPGAPESAKPANDKPVDPKWLAQHHDNLRKFSAAFKANDQNAMAKVKQDLAHTGPYANDLEYWARHEGYLPPKQAGQPLPEAAQPRLVAPQAKPVNAQSSHQTAMATMPKRNRYNGFTFSENYRQLDVRS